MSRLDLTSPPVSAGSHSRSRTAFITPAKARLPPPIPSPAQLSSGTGQNMATPSHRRMDSGCKALSATPKKNALWLNLSASPASPSMRARTHCASPLASPASSNFDRFIPARRALSKAIALAQNHANDDVYHHDESTKENPTTTTSTETNAGPSTALELLERESNQQQFTSQLSVSLLELDVCKPRGAGRATPKVLFPAAETHTAAAATHDHHVQLSSIYRSMEGSAASATPIEPLLLSPTASCSAAAILSPPRGHARSQSHSHFSAGVVQSAARALAQRQAFIPSDATRILDCPGLLNDYYLNLVHWSQRTGVLAIALGAEIYLWNQTTAQIDSLTSGGDAAAGAEEEVSSLRWSEDGATLAVGYKTEKTRLFDVASKRCIQTFHNHTARVSALDWNTGASAWMLASGGLDTAVRVQDVRLSSASAGNIVATYSTHVEEVCGLAFSPDGGMQLASGANDNKLCIWNLRASQAASTPGAHLTLTHHRAAVKALAWCPWQENVLASGGGLADGHIRFCHSITGVQTHSIDTRSQVCSLQWSRTERELLSAHGHPDHHLVVWKFPELTRVATLRGHTQRVLHTSLSPDGSQVVSAAADETLRFWKIWRPAPTQKKENKLDAWIRTSPAHRQIR